ncbi:hypothetical protein HPB51_002270 [Rhipicephalus microplus]|uniref:Uncharacterized protein n=1 Tax=Rhipicephalus microplus TaxID=6941 RepID=A0A9J6DYQ8_RHIMP|nr:hypothetical protein HPB51_002270 [Rhipicephalus microplus]
MAAFTERELRAAFRDSSSLVESSAQGALTRINLVKNVFTMYNGAPRESGQVRTDKAEHSPWQTMAVNAYIAPPDRSIQGSGHGPHIKVSADQLHVRDSARNPRAPIAWTEEKQHLADQQCSPACIACSVAHKTGDILCRHRIPARQDPMGKKFHMTAAPGDAGHSLRLDLICCFEFGN